MFKLRTGYLFTGIFFGIWILISFLTTLPDGKLHVVFCSVGQGDAAYIRFPDGRDMVIDGGPNNKVLDCLSRHMPFWDRSIDIVAMTHPQKDHMQGLLEVMKRYQIGYFVRSEVDNTTQGYRDLQAIVGARKIPVHTVVAGDMIALGATTLSFLWPSQEQIAKAKSSEFLVHSSQVDTNVLGFQAPPGDINDYSLVFHLAYAEFDAVFTGDADNRVSAQYIGKPLGDDPIEVLKVPHHGSKTGMTREFVQWLSPEISVISVGNNSYGHPSDIARTLLQQSRIYQTDTAGDVEIITDGRSWSVQEHGTK